MTTLIVHPNLNAVAAQHPQNPVQPRRSSRRRGGKTGRTERKCGATCCESSTKKRTRGGPRRQGKHGKRGKGGYRASGDTYTAKELLGVTSRRLRPRCRHKRTQNGEGLDIQKMIGKTGIEFHWLGYQYMGPGAHLEKRLARGDPGINRLDKIAKQHDIDYSRAKNLKDKWKADRKMTKAIDSLPGRKTPTEFIVKHIMNAKRKLKL